MHALSSWRDCFAETNPMTALDDAGLGISRKIRTPCKTSTTPVSVSCLF
jgi:hypothetical protein